MPKRRANGEGSIYPRKDKAGKVIGWAAQFTDHTGKKRYLYGKTQKEVKNKLKEAIKNNDNGVVIEAKNIKFTDWMTEWLEVYVRPQVKGATYETYRLYVYGHIIPAFPGVMLKDIREDMLQKFLNDKLERRTDGQPGGYSKALVNACRIRLGTALEKAVDLGFIPRNPARKLKVPKPNYEEQHMKVLTKQHQQKLEAHLWGIMKFDYAIPGMFLLMLQTGLRAGEATGIKISDIDFDKSELHISRTVSRRVLNFNEETPFGDKTVVQAGTTKTQKSARIIPISSAVADLLQKTIEARAEHIDQYRERWQVRVRHYPEWLEQGYLFLTRFGNVYDQSPLRIEIANLCKKLDIPRISVHSLRHTFATRWIEAGLDVKTLSEILGHADAKMTLNIYTHSLPEQKKTSMEKFAGLMYSNCEDENEAKNEGKK